MLSNIYGNIYNSTHGGDSFSAGTYLTQLQALAANIENKANVTDILVNDTGNDGGVAAETVYAAMVTFKNYCREAFPNAKIRLVPCTTRRTPTMKKDAYNVWQLMCTTEDGHNMSLMPDVFNILGREYTRLVAADGVHPNQAGAKIIASAMYNCLVEGGYEYRSYGTENFTDGSHAVGSDVVLGTVAYMNWYKDNEKCHIDTQIEFQVSNAKTLQPYWDITYCPAIVEVKNIQSFNEFLGFNMFTGVIGDGTDTYNVTAIVWYDSVADKFFLHLLSTPLGNITLAANTTYKLILNGSIPFDFQ